MRRAIKLAEDSFAAGGSAIAAIVIRHDEIISEGLTTIVQEKDATCHAEINAIRAASKKLDSLYLEDCYLYTTYEPCPMCTSAAIWAKMKGIVFGANRDDQTPQLPWRVYIPSAEVIKNGTPLLELRSDFLRDECKQLLRLTRQPS